MTSQHRGVRIFCLVTSLLVFAGRSPSSGRADGPPTPPGSASPRTTEVVFDLAVAATAGTVLSAPKGMVRVVFEHRAPGADYRVRKVDPSAPVDASARVISHIHWNFGAVAPKECAPFSDAVHEFLATVDEATGAARLENLRSTAFPPECPSEAFAAQALPKEMRADTFVLLSADPPVVPFTVERLDGRGAVARTWTFELRTAKPDYGWELAHEQDFIAGEIARQIVALTAPPAATPPRVRVSTPVQEGSLPTITVAFGATTSEVAVPVTGHVWNVNAYVPLASRIAGRKKSTARAAPGDLLARLTAPTIDVLLEEDARLGRALSEQPFGPSLHEQAALLAATMGLREAAGIWSDRKPALVRVAAHLAVARAQAPRTGLEGQLAEVVLLALGGRGREALQDLDALDARLASPAGRAWSAALRLRITGDWRAKPSATPAPLLERLERFRALLERRGDDAATQYLRESKPEALPDWGRILLGGDFSVDAGHTFATAALAMEAAEFAQAWKAAFHADLDAAEFGAALAGGRAPREAAAGGALGFPFLRAFAVRHVLHAADRQDYFRTYMLGQQPDVEGPREALVKWLSGLPEAPLLILRWHEKQPQAPQVNGVCPGIAEFVRRRPESTPASLWQLSARIACYRQRDDGLLPLPTEWFSPVIPQGTAYEAGSRTRMFFESLLRVAPTAGRPPDQGPINAWLNAARTANPWEAPVAVTMVARAPQGAGLDELKALVGDLLDYDVFVMKAAADHSTKEPAVYSTLAARAAALDPGRWFALGRYLADHEQDDEAAAAFEKGVERTADRVQVSLGINWLLDYYLAHGEAGRASKVATEAAETGSAGGLLSQARVYERLGDLSAAEAVYRTASERYERPAWLQAFYVRRQRRGGGDAFAAAAKEAMQAVFPDGLRRLDPATVSAPPPDAVPGREFEELRSLGVQAMDRMLAIDGYAVATQAQAETILTWTDDPQTSVVVWRNKPIELSGRVHRRLYGPPAPPTPAP